MGSRYNVTYSLL